MKELQSMLGSAPAAMVLDACADLFGDDLDALAEHLDAGVMRRTSGFRGG